MENIAAAIMAIAIFGSGFAAAAYLGVNGHPVLALVALLILGSVSIKTGSFAKQEAAAEHSQAASPPSGD